MVSILTLLAFTLSFDEAAAWFSSQFESSTSSSGFRHQVNPRDTTFAESDCLPTLARKGGRQRCRGSRNQFKTSLQSSSQSLDGVAVKPLSSFSEVEASDVEYSLRFRGVSRLYGNKGLHRLRNAHVVIIGVGGVGGWAAEALCRSGVGKLTLADLDEVCISNTNRQVHALASTVGKPKTSVLKARLLTINPECCVHEVCDFVDQNNVDRVLTSSTDAQGGTPPTVVLDLMDSVEDKCSVVLACRRKGIPVVEAGAAGGKRDPTKVRADDIARARNDKLMKALRKTLRQKHGWPKEGVGVLPKPWSLLCVYGDEKAAPFEDFLIRAADDENEDGNKGDISADSASTSRSSNVGGACDAGLGTSCFVTGAFGFAAAGVAVDMIVGRNYPTAAYDYSGAIELEALEAQGLSINQQQQRRREEQKLKLEQ